MVLAQTLPINLGVPRGRSMLRGNLFALCVGESTKSRKSEAVNYATDFLNDAAVGRVLEVPGSPEGAIEAIRDAKGQGCFMYPEFGQFLASTERGYAVPIKTLFTNAYDCAPIGRALARKREGAIKDVRVSIFGGSTIDFLERHTEPADWTGGFLARFLTIYADRERVIRLQPPNPDTSVEKRLIEHLQTLAGLDSFAGPCRGFTPEAERMWNEWFDETEARATDSAREVQAGVYRAHSMAQKIALILSWDDGRARTGAEWWVEPDMLTYAMRIVNLHLDSVLEIGRQLASSKDGRDQRAVLHVLEKAHGPVSLGEVITLSKVGLKKRVLEVMDTLAERNEIVNVSQNGKSFYLARELLGAHLESVNGTAHRLNGHNGNGLLFPPMLETIDDAESSSSTAAQPVELEPVPEPPADATGPVPLE